MNISMILNSNQSIENAQEVGFWPEALPPELLKTIFSNLNYLDLQNAAFVTRDWKTKIIETAKEQQISLIASKVDTIISIIDKDASKENFEGLDEIIRELFNTCGWSLSIASMEIRKLKELKTLKNYSLILHDKISTILDKSPLLVNALVDKALLDYAIYNPINPDVIGFLERKYASIPKNTINYNYENLAKEHLNYCNINEAMRAIKLIPSREIREDTMNYALRYLFELGSFQKLYEIIKIMPTIKQNESCLKYSKLLIESGYFYHAFRITQIPPNQPFEYSSDVINVDSSFDFIYEILAEKIHLGEPIFLKLPEITEEMMKNELNNCFLKGSMHFMRKNLFDQAIEIALKAPPHLYKDVNPASVFTVYSLTIRLAKKGFVDEANEIAKFITDERLKELAISNIQSIKNKTAHGI